MSKKPYAVLGFKGTPTQRLFSKVVLPSNPNGCWEWLGGKNGGPGNGGGYAKIYWDHKTRPAHKVIWELFNGPVPPPLVCDHLCNNPGCVNPGHLQVVTEQVNILRGNSLSARRARMTECKNGHPFTEENTRITKKASGHIHRSCRICDGETYRKWCQENRETKRANRRAFYARHREKILEAQRPKNRERMRELRATKAAGTFRPKPGIRIEKVSRPDV